MSRETIVPSIPDIRADNAPDVLRAIKNTLDVREGRIGDPLDQMVTLRDLKDIGVVAGGGSSVLTNGARVPVIVPTADPDGYKPGEDLTTPPAPTGLTAHGGFSNVYLAWDGAAYRNHAYTEIWRATTNNLGSAVKVGTSSSNLFADAAAEGTTYYYWIRFVSVADIIGPYNSTAGTPVTTATDPGPVLDLLTGQITESQLFQSLGDRINLIDGSASIPGSVNARIATVQSQVSDLLNTQAYDNTRTYAEGATVTYNGSLYQSLQATTGNLPTNTTYWAKIGEYASLGDAVAAHTQQIGTLQTSLSTEVYDRQTLATQLRGSYSGSDPSMLQTGLIYNERQARITADGVISSSVSTLSATVSNNYATLNAAIVNEQIARSSADSSFSSQLTTLTSDYKAADTATLSSAQAYVQTYSYSKSATDSAIASQVNTVSSRLNSGGDIYTSIVTAQTTATSKSANFVQSTTPTATKIGDLWIDTANGNILKRWTGTAWVLADDQRIGTSASNITQLTSRLDNVNGTGSAVTLEQQFYTNASQIVGLQSQYSIKIDNNGHVSGFGLSSATVNGVPTSAFIVRADRFAIAGANDTTDPLGTLTPSRLPFLVTTTNTTVNGKTYPPGTWINTAFIANATIGTAQISDLTADKITTGSLTASISVNTGQIYGGVNPFTGWQPGSVYFGTGFYMGNWGGYYQLYVGSPSKYLLWNGSDLTVRGIVYASAGAIGSMVLDSYGLHSSNYTSGSTGFAINNDGSMDIANGSFRGTVTASLLKSADGKFVIDLANKYMRIEV